MDLEVLKKKISSYRTDGGKLKNVSDEVLMEMLIAWEHWTGPAKGFAAAIGINRLAIPKLIGKAKKLKRDGLFPVSDFKEIKIQESPSNLVSLTSGPSAGIEILWDNGTLIRFQQVEQLVDFLRAVSVSCADPACQLKKVA